MSFFHNSNLNKNIPIPLYYQLKEIILEGIMEGILKPGEAIPTERELSELYDISRPTIRQAVIELVRDGYLYRVKGKGTFVSRPKIEQDFVKHVENFNYHIKSKGMVPKTEVMEKSPESASKEIANILNIPEGDKVIKMVRLRSANDEPIVIVKSYLPYDKCAFIMNEDMSKKSLYEAYSEHHYTKLSKAVRTVEATIAGKYESELLNIKEGYPIQLFRTVAYNTMEVPVEYSIARYRGDRNKFTVELKAWYNFLWNYVITLLHLSIWEVKTAWEILNK